MDQICSKSMPKSDEAYYHNERSDVLPLVPAGVKRTLDVGCGAGAFGSLLKEKFGAEVWGIEAVAEVAAFAEHKLDRLFVGDFEASLDLFPKNCFDLISFNDVLEHMVWPDRALAAARTLLSDRGCVVASIPNMRYWHNLWHLVIEQDFRYEDSGIRDRTHLRWFTRKSALRMFEECGYRVDRVDELHKTRSKPLRIWCTLTRGKHLDCYPLQFAIRAYPK